jgi:hypothetical protein
MVSTSGAPGELLFESYLAENGCSFEHEPDLGISSRPDYLVQREGATIICEVKSFSLPAAPPPIRDGPLPITGILGPVRNKIRDAARQLRPLRGSGLALVVVLAMPENSPIVLGAAMMLSAMYGDLTPWPAEAGVGRWLYGRNGQLRNDHPYISAVAVLQRRTATDEALIRLYGSGASAPGRAEAAAPIADSGEERKAGRPADRENQQFLYVDVYETANAAPRIPAGIFEGSRDTRWAADPARGKVMRRR